MGITLKFAVELLEFLLHQYFTSNLCRGKAKHKHMLSYAQVYCVSVNCPGGFMPSRH